MAGTRRMELGIGVPSTDLLELQRLAARADGYGFAFTSVGDNPGSMSDTFVALTLLAASTAHARVGTTVTNPIRRDPLVVATAASSVATLAPGRVFLGMSSGRAEQASVDRLDRFVRAMRDLWAHGHAEHDGATLELRWDAQPVPIMIGANGPRMLRLAGRVADAVLVEAGVTEAAIAHSVEAVHAGAREAGRDPAGIEMWWYVRANVADTYDEALHGMRAALAAAGAHVLRGDLDARLVPREFHDQVRALHAGYDFHAHLVTGDANPNARLITDDRFLHYLADRFAVTGSPDDWSERLQVLASRGIERVFVAAVVADYPGFLDRVGREVLPTIAASP